MSLICAMAQTLIKSQSERSSMTPSLIIDKLRVIGEDFELGKQSDANEFSDKLIEKMDQEFLERFSDTMNIQELDKESKETTPLSQIFGGMYQSTMTCPCPSCKHVSITYEHSWGLNLDISKDSATNHAIHRLFQPEFMKDYKCTNVKECHHKGCTKQVRLYRPPKVLKIHLKRFKEIDGKIVKDKKHFSFKQYLYLRNYTISKRNSTYRLVSTINHWGESADSGHYTANARAYDGQYYKFDDETVTLISSVSELQENACTLIYELININEKFQINPQYSIFDNEPRGESVMNPFFRECPELKKRQVNIFISQFSLEENVENLVVIS